MLTPLLTAEARLAKSAMVWMYTTFAALPAFTHVGSSLDCAPFRAFKIGRPFSVYVHAESPPKIVSNCAFNPVAAS